MAETLPYPDYKLRIFDKSCDFKFEITDYLSLSYQIKVNTPGLVQFSLSAEHELTEQDFDKWQVEVWRKPYGQDWSREIIGFIRRDDWDHSDLPVMTYTCPGLMQMLSWREILYPVETANRTLFIDANIETICNTLVKYNATTSGTTGDGRDKAAAGGYPFTGLSVEADGVGGNTYDGGFYCARKNLLKTLQELAEVGSGDFNVVKTSATAWQWRWYEDQLGTDRSSGGSKVVFAMERGNMANPKVINDRIGVKTSALVAGEGTGSDRDTAVVTSDDYAVDNDIELFVDARDVKDSDGLDSRGEERLREVREKEVIQFDVLQTENSQYGVHYMVGDKCAFVNPKNDAEGTIKVMSASIAHEKGGKETVDVEVEGV